MWPHHSLHTHTECWGQRCCLKSTHGKVRRWSSVLWQVKVLSCVSPCRPEGRWSADPSCLNQSLCIQRMPTETPVTQPLMSNIVCFITSALWATDELDGGSNRCFCPRLQKTSVLRAKTYHKGFYARQELEIASATQVQMTSLWWRNAINNKL